MESIPSKKPRMELPNAVVEKSNTVLCEEIVEHMDIVGNERESHPSKDKPEVANTPSTDRSSSADWLMAQKASHKNQIRTTNVATLFEKFWSTTNKKPKNLLLGEEFGPGQFHLWGLLTKMKKSSCTLNELTSVTLENINNYKDTFLKILEELNFDYSVLKLTSRKPEEFPYVVVFNIESTPKYSFCGYGTTEDVAINLAAKHGLNFFVTSCQ